jgi:hypothetical protein
VRFAPKPTASKTGVQWWMKIHSGFARSPVEAFGSIWCCKFETPAWHPETGLAEMRTPYDAMNSKVIHVKISRFSSSATVATQDIALPYL